MSDSGRSELETLSIDLLVKLHSEKSAGYGDAWRKRGELLSIFTNLARKYDRLVVALDRDVRSKDERMSDTAGDLCVYAGKYLTWLAEMHPQEFDMVSRGASSSECSDELGADALGRVLAALELDAEVDATTAWARLKNAFEPLDRGFVAQATGSGTDGALAWEVKVELAWAVAASSAELLVAFATEESQDWDAWREEIETML